jgi:hypothetical protein
MIKFAPPGSEFRYVSDDGRRLEEGSMKAVLEAIRIPKKEFDALCPHCRSRAVYLIGAYRTESGVIKDQVVPPGTYIETWCCAVCYQSFELF